MILPERVFGRPGAHWISQASDRANFRAYPCAQLLAQLFGWLFAAHQSHVAIDALAFDVVGIAHDGGFGDFRVRDQRAFDFGRAHAVARDVDHVVDAPCDPIVAICVAFAAVTGEVVAFVVREIGLSRTARDRPKPCASDRASCP